jgi:hypothetical protein
LWNQRLANSQLSEEHARICLSKESVEFASR